MESSIPGNGTVPGEAIGGQPHRPLISEDYRKQLAAMHSNELFGSRGWKRAKDVQYLADRARTKDILDYGCGKGALAHASPTYNVTNYDPGIAQFAEHPPEPHDIVACCDVLEHIEPECIDAVLEDLQYLTKRCLYVVVSLRNAQHSLPDGRNTHLLVRPYRWWLDKFLERWEIRYLEVFHTGGHPDYMECALKPKHEDK
jgi:2-polyprenyl-3-methyl-5-hydroxy-6-metoxy-1,4-benzoquinol methylase